MIVPMEAPEILATGGAGRTAAVVVSFNSAVDLPECLESLKACKEVAEILVVDNASRDDSVAVARAAGVKVLDLDENTGFAGGCNVGFAALASSFEYLAFLNPDVRLLPNCISACIRVLEENQDLGGVAPLLLRPDGVHIDSAGQCLKTRTLEVEDRGYGLPLEEYPLKPTPVLAACGALAVFRTAALIAVTENRGPWAESYFCFWEDLELGWRLNNNGWRILFTPEARAIHRRGAGAGEGSGPLRWRRPPRLEACILSNRWMTLLRHLNSRDFLRKLPWLLIWDFAVTGAGILRRPVLLRHLLPRWPLLRREWKGRKDRPQPRLNEYPC